MENIVVIAVEKIQRYIFRSIDKNPEDQQSLREVIAASNQVAGDILEEIKRDFDLTVSDERGKGDTLLWISGKVVFYSGLSTEEIQSKLKTLFEKIYTEYQGDIVNIAGKPWKTEKNFWNGRKSSEIRIRFQK